MMNLPVVSPTVIGTAIVPGVAITAGKDTETLVPKLDDVALKPASRVSLAPAKTVGAAAVFKPRNSTVESMKA